MIKSADALRKVLEARRPNTLGAKSPEERYWLMRNKQSLLDLKEEQELAGCLLSFNWLHPRCREGAL